MEEEAEDFMSGYIQPLTQFTRKSLTGRRKEGENVNMNQISRRGAATAICDVSNNNKAGMEKLQTKSITLLVPRFPLFFFWLR